MKTTNNYFSRVLCALMLCAGLMVTSCTEGPLEQNENTEQGGSENQGGGEKPGQGGENQGGQGGPAEGEGDVVQTEVVTMTLGEVTATTATFTGHLDVPASDLSFSQITVYYSDSEPFNVNTAQKVSTTTFDDQQNFTITLQGLKSDTKYNYSLVAEVKSEKDYSDVADFTTAGVVAHVSVVESSITATTASFSGTVTGLSEDDKQDIEVGVAYSLVSDDLKSSASTKVAAGEISEDGALSISVDNLASLTKYYYCSYVKQNDVYTYGDVNEFTTTQKDLTENSSANSYIVSKAGGYSFKTVKGNSSESVGAVAKAEVLWESFGTDTAPSIGDLVKNVTYKDGYIAFEATDKKGNAVIAAKDASGNILWSWHIWLTDQPQAQVYKNNAGTMMDRNLGATSATPGDVGALGLLYQWGRKDPFLGSSSISSNTLATSTLSWPSAVSSNSSRGTIDYVTANPTTYVYASSSYDWHYGSRNNTLWQSEKTIYDPCPPGWRVPNGGSSGVWSTAVGSSSRFDYTYNSANEGMNFSGKFGSASTIWYPASGYRNGDFGGLSNVGGYGCYWSVAPIGSEACSLSFNSNGSVYSSSGSGRVNGFSVRCLQESK